MKFVKHAAIALLSTTTLTFTAVADVPVADRKGTREKVGVSGNYSGQQSFRQGISKSTEGVRCSWERSPGKALADRADVAAKIANTCQKVGVDPAFALSIAYQESQFNQNCVAPKTPHSGGERAEGVMQVLPATGKRMFRKAGLGSYNGKNEDQNIMAGCLYLKEGFEITKGSRYHVAGGYHAGYGSKIWRDNLAIPKGMPKTLNYANAVNKKWLPFFEGKVGAYGGGSLALDEYKANVALSSAYSINAAEADSQTLSTRISEESQNIGKFDTEMTEWQTNSKVKLFNAQAANQLIEVLTLLAQFKQLEGAMDVGAESFTSELTSTVSTAVRRSDDLRVAFDTVEGRWKLHRADGSWTYIDANLPETVALVPTDPTVVATTQPTSPPVTATARATVTASTEPASAPAAAAASATVGLSAAARVSALLAD